MKKAVIYCRVSSERQVKEGHGNDGQESNCRKYADYHQFNVVKVFKDEGISGGVLDRPGIDALLNYLESHRNDGMVVIIDDLKRLARDVVTHFQLKKLIESANATLESPSHTFEDTPEGKFQETILAANAELERNQNKRQVTRRMKARLEAGYWPFYAPPGYHNGIIEGNQKSILPTEPQAGIIKEALEGFASGRFETQLDVLQFLRSKEFDHWKTGRGTYLGEVRRLLTREVYAGYIYFPKWNVTRRKGHHQALVSPDTFQLIQDRLAEKKKNPQRKDIHKDFPLRGFVLCAECKQPMTAAWTQGRSQKYPYYRCRANGCSMHNKNIAKDTIETQFEEVLAQIKPRENILEVVRIELLAMTHQRTFNVEATRKRRNDRVHQIKADIDIFCNRIKEAHSPAVIKAYEEKIEALEAEKLRLGETIKKSETGNFQFEPALNRVVEFIKDPLLMWKTGDLEQKRLVLRMVFEEPLVYDNAKGFYTEEFSPKLALLLKISCIPCLDEMERKKMVEMPGFEPGSNVYTWCPYDHVPFNSRILIRKEPRRGASDDAK